MITNSEISSRLYEMAKLASLAEGSPNAFRVRAYETAARALDGLTEDAASLTVSQLVEIRGIGKGTAAKIVEFIESGHIARLDEMREQFPPSFVEMTKVPGVGPKTAVLLRDELGVADVESLKQALADQRLRQLPGLGPKTEENIARALERLGIGGKDDRRTSIIDAMRLADEVKSALGRIEGVDRVEVMGSLRRFRETIGDIDVIVIGSLDPEAVMERFVKLPLVAEVVGYGARKTAIVTASGMQIDLRVFGPDQYGSAALYFTGSKAHNIRLRQLAIDRGWVLSEYSLSDAETGTVIASETEGAVYSALGMSWVPPELREDAGEVEMALEGEFTQLVTEADLLGDLHVHTDLSGDGRDGLEVMVDGAVERGYRYLAITDHAEDLAINGASRTEMLQQRAEIEILGSRHKGLALLHGAELNIGRDGSVDYDPEFLSGFDFGVASVHSFFDLDVGDQTNRVIAAIRNPAVNVIGHLTGRRIGRRPGIELDFDAVFAAAADAGCAIEINSHLDRLDAPADTLRRAAHQGVVFAISTDAHDLRELGNAKWGVRNARRGWVERDRVVNTWEPEKFLSWVAEKRHGPAN